MPTMSPDPGADCPICPRLVAFRLQQRLSHPDWFNAPVPTFGDPDARLLVVGLAPGLKGANRTGRPFTGDFAGELLYGTLREFGFARGEYAARPDDGLDLVDAAITNAVRCVPPQNKPTGAEIRSCRSFLSATLDRANNVRVIVCLGRVAHDSVLRMLGAPLAAHPFTHSARHAVERTGHGRRLTVADSYHCSRYNTNTGVLTPAAFRQVFAAVRAELDGLDGTRRAGALRESAALRR
jgi:uracil-DNA glycosylase family 4